MAVNLKQSKFYFNRELSWLKFNDRVLEEAQDTRHPLLERLKFVSIFSSNLDEFYMIRVAGLKDQVAAHIRDIPADGLTPDEQLERISTHVHEAVALQAHTLKKDILPELRKKGIRLRAMNSVRKHDRIYLEQYFREQVYPVLTPLAVDPTHPFPQLKSLGLNLVVELRTPYRNDYKIAVIHLPSKLERFVPLPSENGKMDFVMIEDLIQKHVRMLFPNMKILGTATFRITRNADLDLSEAEADDLLKLIERELRKRRLGTVIRLEVDARTSPRIREFLKTITGLEESDIFDIPTYLDLAAFMKWLRLPFRDLKDQPFSPSLSNRLVAGRSIFKTLRQGDIILHHPYDSFNHVVDLIQEAAEDPKVLAIKQTLYRTSGKSPIVKALKTAVNNGKQVTALIELKARFDEENNIEWAKELDREGINVVYGVLGLKTHCKIAMVVRQEGKRVRRYLHLGTGNYNATTAKIYTDVSMMTCEEELGEDASSLFNLLTGYSLQKSWNKMLIAPATLRNGLAAQMKACIAEHEEGAPARMILVMNSLVDPEMIRLLYQASIAGVKVDLVVRGICCLVPGVKGISENIQVKSIVGRFLEHCRIFYFKYSGKSHIFMGSADLMQRNLNRRVEIIFPVEEAASKRRVREILQVLLDDKAKTRYLQPDGRYTRPKDAFAKDAFHAQNYLLDEAKERQKSMDTIGMR